MQPGKDPISSPQGENVEYQAQRVQRRVLPIGQERVTGEDVRIPEWQFSVVDRLDQELLPGVVLQNQIGDQMVLGKGYSQGFGELSRAVSGCRLVWLEQEEVVGWQQRFVAQGNGGKQQER